MKQILIGVLLLAATASSAINQKAVLGNWTLLHPQNSDQHAIIMLEHDSLKITDDWKFEEISTYTIHYPEYGKNKIDLKYKLKVVVGGEYRINGDALQKYQSRFEPEVVEESASDMEAATASLKEIEKLIKEELKFAAAVLHVSDTELELQGAKEKHNLKYVKPKKLPVSKLTGDTIPFFAPEGWRYPETAKELANFAVRLKNSKNLLTVVKADFNGDDLIDAVAYLMNDETGQVSLFMNISKDDGTYELKPYGNAEKNTVVENGIMLATAGEHVNAKDKSKVTIDNPGFIEVIFDTAAYLVYWDLRANDWVRISVGKKL